LAPPRTQGPLDLAPVIVAIGLNWLYALVVGGARFDKET
jgi:hypothetical protein